MYPENNMYQQPAGYQQPAYAGQVAGNGNVAPKEGDVRYVTNNSNKFRLCGNIMTCTKVMNEPGKATIVEVQISNPLLRNSNNGSDAFNIITLIGAVADRALKHFQIGDKIIFHGEVHTSSYQNRQTGENAFSTSLVANSFDFAESQDAKAFRQWKKAQRAIASGQQPTHVESIGENFARRQANRQQQGGYQQAPAQQPAYQQAPVQQGAYQPYQQPGAYQG